MMVGQRGVDGPAAVDEAVRRTVEAGRPAVLLLVRRDGAERFVTVSLSSA